MKNTRNLILYLTGNNTSVFGDILLTTAIALHVMNLTQSPQSFGSLMAAAYIPRFFFSFFSGTLVDRADRKTVMIFLDLLRGIILFLFLLLNVFSVKLVTLLILTFALVDTFYSPASVSIVPRMFNVNELSSVNGLDQSIRSTLNVFSPMLASLIYLMGGLKLIIIIDGCTFLLSAAIEWFFQVEKEQSRKERFNILGGIRDGISEIGKDKRVVSLMFNGALTHLFLFSFIEVGMISLLLITFHAPETHYGILQSVMSGSAIAASLLVLAFKDSHPVSKQINIGILGMLGSALLFIPLISPSFIHFILSAGILPLIYLSIACAFMFVSFGYYVVFFRSFYQREVPKSHLGRFSGFFMVLVSASKITGLFIYGILFEKGVLIYPVCLLFLGMIFKLIVHIPFLQIEKEMNKEPLSDII